MSAAVVWLTRGGIVESVAGAGIDLVVIDFQNLEGGDEVPELSPGQRKLLEEKAPQLLKDLDAYAPKFECDNCRKRFRDTVPLVPVIDIHQRVDIGEPMPAGECPSCGCLVHPIKDEPEPSGDWQIPAEDLARYGLSGRFSVQAAAMPHVVRCGLDSLLRWFSKKQKPAISIGETREIAGMSLKAFFGLDDKQSGGDAFFVTIMEGQ